MLGKKTYEYNLENYYSWEEHVQSYPAPRRQALETGRLQMFAGQMTLK